MKRRLNFVSNSSSSSFIAIITNNTFNTISVQDLINKRLVDLYERLCGDMGELLRGLYDHYYISDDIRTVDRELINKALIEKVKVEYDMDNASGFVQPGHQIILYTRDGDEFDFKNPWFEVSDVKNNTNEEYSITIVEAGC